MVNQHLAGALDDISLLRDQILRVAPKNTELRGTLRSIANKLETADNQPMVPLSEHREICNWLGQFLDVEHGTNIGKPGRLNEQNRKALGKHIQFKLELIMQAEHTLPLVLAALQQAYSLLGASPEKPDIHGQMREFVQHLQEHLKDDERLRGSLNTLILSMKKSLEEVTHVLSDLADESPELSNTAALLQQELPDDPEAARAILQSAQEGIIKAGKQISAAGNALRETVEHQTKQVQELTESLDQARQQAFHDALTGLANRRKMETYIAAFPDTAVTFCMLDLDYFKRINDRYGHDAGDEILIGLANILTDNVRATDMVARMGGEELAVILPGISGRKAFDMAETLRRAVEMGGFKCRAGKIAVTVSIGVAVRRAGEEAHHWIKRADTALYEAKKAGRNCVKVSVD